MSQHDLTIDNQGFPAFRADLNNALQALGSTQSGTTAPSPAFANQLWYDTTNNILKIRNEDNDAWISVVTLDQSADVTSGVGAKTLPTGDLVGTSDSQTLTNKTINASQLVDASVTPAKLSTNAQYTGFKNRIINGAMVIDQRNAGASVTPTSSAYTLDRWQAILTQASKFSVQQNAGSVTPPAGFTNYLGATSTSAYSVPTSDYFLLQQSIEGFNVADLGFGTANAKTVTLSFWVRSSLTGTFGGVLSSGGFTRCYPFTYTISAANTWEYETITIAGDTSGTWLTTNGTGMIVNFNLGSGATVSGTAGAWSSTLYTSATGATSVVGTNGATFYITGVQLEVGSTATSFDYRPIGTELVLCQRYFEKSYQQGVALGASGQGNTGQTFFVGTGNTLAGSDKIPNTTFMVTKRTAPTINTWSTNGTANTLANMGGTDLATNSCTPNVANDRSFFAYNATSNVSGTNGCVQFQWAASAEL